MKFDSSRFDHIWLTENSDAPRRLVGVCVSREGDLTLVPVQDSIRPELNTLATGNSRNGQVTEKKEI